MEFPELEIPPLFRPPAADVTVVISPSGDPSVDVSTTTANTPFYATVLGPDSQLWPDQTVIWSVTGGTPDKASIGADGVFHPNGETLTHITVRAAAKANMNRYAEAAVGLVPGVVATHPALRLSDFALTYDKGAAVGGAVTDPIPPVQVTVLNATAITAAPPTGQNGSLTYQWYKSDSNIPVSPPPSGSPPPAGLSTQGSTNGADTAVFKPDTAAAGRFYYYVRVTNTITTPSSDTSVEWAGPVLVTVVQTTVTNAAEWHGAIEDIKNQGSGSYTIPIGGAGPIIVDAAECFTDNTFSEPGDPSRPLRDISVTLTGTGTLKLPAGTNGSLLWLGERQTVTLDGPTLEGKASNDSPLVNLGENSTFFMSAGAIKDNKNLNGRGPGGVWSSGTFFMTGGSITYNETNEDGGGVLVSRTFIMTGGSITNNKSNNGGGGGGGVAVPDSWCLFSMSGGTAEIHDNEATNGAGGGVYVNAGTFQYNRANGIGANTASANGQKIYKKDPGTVTGSAVPSPTSGQAGPGNAGEWD